MDSCKEIGSLQTSIAYDTWAGRAKGMKCGTCVFFVEKKSDEVMKQDPRGNIGRCRRHAPTMSGYPVVFTSDWCGDHRLDENKI
jgi:hypothetical protein